jgi:hypothetical protein
MTFSKKYLSPILALATAIVIPAGGQQDNKQADVNQSAKSIMRKMFEEDQKDRTDSEGDKRRRAQVRQLMSEGKIQTAEDYFYAAFIFQHGNKPSDYLYAHILATTAVDKGLHAAMWLSAASLDRYLYFISQPQVFGTQFGSPFTDTDDQEPYDRKMISDKLRALWCVAPLSAQEKILNDARAGKEFTSTRTCPLPDQQFEKH